MLEAILNRTKQSLIKEGFNLSSVKLILKNNCTMSGYCCCTKVYSVCFPIKLWLSRLCEFPFQNFSLLWVFALLIFFPSCLLPHRSSLTGAGQPGGNSCTYRLQWKRLRFSSQCFPGSTSSHATRCKFSGISSFCICCSLDNILFAVTCRNPVYIS